MIMTNLNGLAPKSTSAGVKTVTSKVDSASSFSSVTSEHFQGPVSLTFEFELCCKASEIQINLILTCGCEM